MKKGVLCIGFLLGGFGSLNSAFSEPDVRISPFSEKPVPRFESLQSDKVYGRRGPSFEHPIDWTYRRAGLPVMIIKESTVWRRVRDPSGVEVWVHKRLLSSEVTGVTQQDVLLKRTAEPASDDLAIIKSGVIVDVLDELDGMVKIRTANTIGWTSASHIWGHSQP